MGPKHWQLTWEFLGGWSGAVVASWPPEIKPCHSGYPGEGMMGATWSIGPESWPARLWAGLAGMVLWPWEQGESGTYGPEIAMTGGGHKADWMSKKVAKVGTWDSFLLSETNGASLGSGLCKFLQAFSFLTWLLLRMMVSMSVFIASTPCGVLGL